MLSLFLIFKLSFFLKSSNRLQAIKKNSYTEKYTLKKEFYHCLANTYVLHMASMLRMLLLL